MSHWSFLIFLSLLFILSKNSFSVNAKELEVGQENLYEDPCQDWLDLINERLTSPNYPDVYDPNTFCRWNLTTNAGSYITLNFEMIDVCILL